MVVRMMSGTATPGRAASSDVDLLVRDEFRVGRSLDGFLGNRGGPSVRSRSIPRGQRLHVPAVTSAPKSRQHHAAEHVQRGVGVHQRGAAFVPDAAVGPSGHLSTAVGRPRAGSGRGCLPRGCP